MENKIDDKHIVYRDQNYSNKINFLKENIENLLSNSKNITYINEYELLKLFDLLKYENILVSRMPIFKDNNIVFGFNDKKNNNDYFLLTIDEIENYLKNEDIVFIYTFTDCIYENIDKIKYRSIIYNNK